MARLPDQMMKTILMVGVLVSLVAIPANAGRLHVFSYSQQYESSAAIGSSITVRRAEPGGPRTRRQPSPGAASRGSDALAPKPVGGATSPLPPASYPALPASSPLLKEQQPRGPGTFWYEDGTGHLCEYVGNATPACFTVTGATAPATPALSPIEIATEVADRLPLSPGQISTSPAQAGLTGAPSWFWLDPTPAAQHLSTSLDGESVTVTAVPEIEWQFGDATTATGQAGVPYRPGPIPPEAVTHAYQTRCLPGDQGRDPYVLASCGTDGYQLVATVSWAISYTANGSVATTGILPTRTTTSSVAYPVSEARGFLTGPSA